MSIRITDAIDTNQRVYGIPITTGNGSGGMGASEWGIRYMDGIANSGSHSSLVCSYFCEMGTGNLIDHTIWEMYSGTTPSFGLRLAYFGATGWVLNATYGGNNSLFGSPTGLVLPYDPRNKWMMCSVAYQDRNHATVDRVYLSVYDFDSGQTYTTNPVGAVYTNASPTRPRHASLTNQTMYTLGTNETNARNAKGICIPAIVSGLVIDGGTYYNDRSIALAEMAQSGIMGHISYNNFANCFWATNHANITSTNSTAVNEGRLGSNLGSFNFATFDKFNSLTPLSHGANRGATSVGTLPFVNPFLYGDQEYPAPSITGVTSDASPATSVPTSGTGSYGEYATKFADSILNGTRHNVRVGIHGNSRAVYPSPYYLRLSDSTYPNRYFRTNFVDTGIHGQAPIYNNGLVIGCLEPVPTCLWSNANGTTFVFTTETAEGEYGADCKTTLLRCLDSAGTAVSTQTVLSSMARTTLGSRFGLTSRLAGDPVSNGADAANYRGNHTSARLAPDCSYRVMVQPELGLPVTDGLRLRIYFTNHPSSSTVASAKKVVASTQNAVEDSSTAITELPGLGTESTFTSPALKAITAVQAPTLTNQVTHSVYGSVTVNDADNGFAELEVGDLVQLYSSADVSNVYNEAFLARTITGKGTATCVISYEWKCRQVPVIGDKITFTKYNEIFKYIECSFTANEVASGKWRGIEIKAGATGDGLVLWGFEYYNPDKEGIFAVPLGRSGMGSWYQASRLPRIVDPEGKTLFQRITDILDLDLLLFTTADQGDAGGFIVEAYTNLYDYWHEASPTTEKCFWSTGPEFDSTLILNKNDKDASKLNYHACMSYVAAQKGVPWDGFLMHRYTSAFTRYLTGDDTTESPTHPSTTLDLTFWAQNVFTSSYWTGTSGGFLRALKSLNAMRVLK